MHCIKKKNYQPFLARYVSLFKFHFMHFPLELGIL